MTSQAATAAPFPPHVGGRLMVALAQALQGREEADLIAGIRRPQTEREAADSARQVALALRTTCRLVASDLAQGTGASAAGGRRPASASLVERLTATATQIGDVLALVDRTTEEMSLLAHDAATLAPGPDAAAAGALSADLCLVASEVSSLRQHTRRANLRVARRVAALRGPEAGGGSRRPAGPAPAAAEVTWLEAGPPAATASLAAASLAAAAETPAATDEFCLLRWLARS